MSVALCVGAALYLYISVIFGFLYLQNLLVQLQALALNEIASSSGHLIRQVPQSTQGKLQSGVHDSHHSLLLHNSKQLLLDRAKEKGKHEPKWMIYWDSRKKGDNIHFCK